MIASQGLDGLSMRALARQVGATTGLVSHHFVDRADVIEAALDLSAQIIIERAAPAIAAAAPPIDLLQAILPTDDATQENWRFTFMIRVAGLTDPDLRRFDRTITEYWHRYLPKLLATHGSSQPDEDAEHVMALVDGIALRAVLEPADWPAAKQAAHLRAGLEHLL